VGDGGQQMPVATVFHILIYFELLQTLLIGVIVMATLLPTIIH
jgi:hypothetical protein